MLKLSSRDRFLCVCLCVCANVIVAFMFHVYPVGVSNVDNVVLWVCFVSSVSYYLCTTNTKSKRKFLKANYGFRDSQQSNWLKSSSSDSRQTITYISTTNSFWFGWLEFFLTCDKQSAKYIMPMSVVNPYCADKFRQKSFIHCD